MRRTSVHCSFAWLLLIKVLVPPPPLASAEYEATQCHEDERHTEESNDQDTGESQTAASLDEIDVVWKGVEKGRR